MDKKFTKEEIAKFRDELYNAYLHYNNEDDAQWTLEKTDEDIARIMEYSTPDVYAWSTSI